MKLHGNAYVLIVEVLLMIAAPSLVSAQQGTDQKLSQQSGQQSSLEEQVKAMARQISEMQKKLETLEGNLAARDAQTLRNAAADQTKAPVQVSASQSAEITQKPGAPPVAPATRPGSTSPAVSSVSPDAVYNLTLGSLQPTTAEQKGHKFGERKPGKDLTFYTKGGEITVYGNLDVSVETATKGGKDIPLGSAGGPPVGNMGWLEDLSTNISFLGVRGTQSTWIKDVNFIYQLETGFNITAAPGIHVSNSQQQSTVDGTLFTRNSYIGLGSVKYGAVLLGKSDPPYKQSTARMNPFAGMEGDYGVVMGNTGGDNRVEFGYRLDHAMWYTSPKLHGVQLNTFFSPGQNRSGTSDNIAAGEPDCTGGDDPGNGGLSPIACNDGSFSDVFSGNISYTREPLYITVAYERHMKVNRQSDMTGMYSGAPPSLYSGPITTNDPTYSGTDTTYINSAGYLFWVPTEFYNAEVADEDAGKVGIQYGFFQKKTVVSAIFESLHRYVPGYLEWQNERQRLGSWVAITQAMGKNDSLSIGWARAYRTPGDPCQHNDCFGIVPYSAPADGDATGGRAMNNQASLYTVAYRHRIGEGLEVYLNFAETLNDQYAHYDLGAGGHGVTTDCHDASDAAGDQYSNPHCWAGGHLKAISLGLQRRF